MGGAKDKVREKETGTNMAREGVLLRGVGKARRLRLLSKPVPTNLYKRTFILISDEGSNTSRP